MAFRSYEKSIRNGETSQGEAAEIAYRWEFGELSNLYAHDEGITKEVRKAIAKHLLFWA